MNEKTKKYNVVIIGGGVAGSFLALHLKKQKNKKKYI